jgi:hypothetical protein
MSKDLKKYKFKTTMFPTTLEIYVGDEQEFLEEVQNKYKTKFNILSECFGRYYYPTEKSPHIIWIRIFDWTIEAQAIMIHELQHFVFKRLNDVGMFLDESSEEAYTYTFQEIFIQVWDKFAEQNPHNKKSKLRSKKK